MKKIMVMLGVVALAACSQAAIVDWGIPNQVKFNGTVLSGKQVQLWIVGVNGADDYQIDLRKTKSTNPAASKGTLAAGNGDGQMSYDYQSTIAGGALVNGSNVDLGREYYIVITATGSDNVNYTYTSSAVASSGLSNTSLGSVSFSFNDRIIESGTDGWVAAVPEPTSGLLLLLGVAGLALKRKRA